MRSSSDAAWSQRRGRTRWVYEIAQQREDAEFELIDIKDFNLQLSDEPVPPSLGQYSKEHTKLMGGEDRFIRRICLRHTRVKPWDIGRAQERHRFPIQGVEQQGGGFVGYGSALGARAVEHLRPVMGELQVADVRAQVGLSLFTDFENFSVFKPAAHQEQTVNAMLEQVMAWGGALKSLRN